MWQTIQGTLVMLCLKAEIALYHDYDFAEQKLGRRLDAFDVALYQRKLFFWFWKSGVTVSKTLSLKK